MLEKTYDPAEIERRVYQRAEDAGAFAAQPTGGGVPYAIMMPPPNVTGSLHMGHALNHTLQDVLTRYRRMQGRDALWQPGTDHAGIATQMVVERMLDAEGTSRAEIGRDAFLERAWAWKAESGGTITSQLRRLGASPDWARERFTLDDGLNRAVREAFVALHREGLIYRDKRLVNWDPKLKTAISDLEVEQREVNGSLWRFRYPIDGDPDGFIVVATTRPETMLGDTAVAVHPEDERYTHLVGKTVRLPIVDRLIPIIADDYADPETGSGAVKITPAHDFNDAEVGRRNALPFINVMDEGGAILPEGQVFTLMVDDAPATPANAARAQFDRTAAPAAIPEAFGGLDRFAARKKVVAWFEDNGLFDGVDDHRHVVPHGDRGGVPIEPWLTDQWYCDAAALAGPAVAAVETGATVFVPKSWENTYFEWMRNIQPWCVSRQLWWGHRIPAWFGPDGAVFVAHGAEEAAEAARQHYGEDQPLTQDPDVLDTWFSSALWPFSTLGWPEDDPYLARYYPSDVLVTGFDIIFFWVARMMMMGLHFTGQIPFKDV
ncbi:MAG: valine--tRNA ligase, partial [Pseudomonadota bacterium]